MCVFSHVRLSATLWTVDHWALCPWHFPGKKYWSGLPFPTPGDLPSPGVKPASLELADGFFHWAINRHINDWDEIITFRRKRDKWYFDVWLSSVMRKNKYLWNFYKCEGEFTETIVVAILKWIYGAFSESLPLVFFLHAFEVDNLF